MGVSIIRESPLAERGFSRRYAVEVGFVEPAAESVYLLCSADGFSRRTNQMEKYGELWRIVLRLLGGEYEYAFLVDGSRVVSDPENTNVRKRPDGSEVSVMRFGVPEDKCERGDGRVDKASIYHDQALPFLEIFREQVIFKLQVARDDIEKASLLLKGGRTLQMDWLSSDDYFDYYECRVSVGFGADYAFKVTDGGTEVYLGAEGPSDSVEGCKAFPFPPKRVPTHDCPDWAMGCLYYQILPDCFRNGDPLNDPKGTLPWGRPPVREGHFGGDLAGLFQAVDYLKELGVSAVRIMPVFVSPSCDKFDVFDYYHVDVHLGTDEMFSEVVDALRARGIRTVLDMVLDHTGKGFFAFRDIVRNQEQSQYVSWYNIHQMPLFRKKSITSGLMRRLTRVPERPPYESYRGRPDWPELNFRNFEVRAFIREIVAHWMKKTKLDGVWIPVAEGLPHPFVAEVRRTVKRARSDAIVIGDVRTDSTSWFLNGELDSATDPGFRAAVADFFFEGKTTPSQFTSRLVRSRGLMPWAAFLAKCNQIDTEFSARVLTAAHSDVTRALMAVIFQLTFPGSPVILYGDELGLSGGPYPDCRKSMVWDAEHRNNEILDLYRRLIRVRSDSDALRTGWFKFIAVDDQLDVVAFQRWTESDTAVVVIRRTGDPQVVSIPVPDGSYRDAISWNVFAPVEGYLTVELAGGSCLVLVQDRLTYQGAPGPTDVRTL
jgi:glycosidase